jgi:hypothetical protein
MNDFCQSADVMGVLIRRRANVAWITDGASAYCNLFQEAAVCELLWTPDRQIVFCDNVEGPRLAAEECGPPWAVEQTPWAAVRPAPAGKLAADMPDDCLVDLRASLNPEELDRLRTLGTEVAHALVALMHRVQPGQSEWEIAADLTASLLRAGILVPVVLVGAYDRISRFRHPIPTRRTLQKLLMVVVCAQRQGLTVAMTRLVHFGALPSELRRRHHAVCRVDEAYHAVSRPGQRWCDALARGIEAYREVGFPEEWEKHFQGGPMGYEPRDYWATPTETRRIVENQAIGWNPSITGSKSEDTILSSGEVITATPDWPLVGTRPDILVRHTVR